MPQIAPLGDICFERPPVVRDPLRTPSPTITEPPKSPTAKVPLGGMEVGVFQAWFLMNPFL